MKHVKIVDIILERISGEWGEEPCNGKAIKVLRTTNFTNEGRLNLSSVAERKIDEHIVREKKLKYGDTIIEKSGGGPTQPVGRVVFFDLPAQTYLCNNFTAILRPRGNVFPKYFFYALFYKHLNKATLRYQNKTTGILNLQLERYLQEEIPLPAFPIQKQIVAILEKAETAREKRRQANHLIEQFLQSAFLEMFGDSVTNPRGWRKLPLIELCINENDLRCGPFGSQLKKEHYKYEGIPVWDIEDVKEEFKSRPRYHITSRKAEELSNYYLQEGDIVMTRRATIGISAVYPSKAGRGIMHSALLRIRTDHRRVDPVFLSNQLSKSRDVENQISRFSSGAIFKSINVSKLKLVQVLVPPLSEQQKFAALVEKVESLRVKQESSQKELENLFNSLMQKAFKGELFKEKTIVPKILKLHPTDRHAAILGKIIREHELNPKYFSTLGHVKGEKVSHLIEYHVGRDLGRNPVRDAAGPVDYQHLLRVEHRAAMNKWFFTKNRLGASGKEYISSRNLDALLSKLGSEMEDAEINEVNRIIRLFLPANSEQAEIAATVYAAWNDLLLEGRYPKDDEIVREARENWTPEKLLIEKLRFFKCIDWLRKKNLTPLGKGKHTIKKREGMENERKQKEGVTKTSKKRTPKDRKVQS